MTMSDKPPYGPSAKALAAESAAIGRWIQRFADLFQRRVIGAERGIQMTPLLIRYFLIRSERFGLYLHRLCRSDEDRALHDHPWTFVSIILTAGYIEHTPHGARRYRPGSILYRPAEWQHRLELNRPAWTLVFRFRRRREWGFHCPLGWVPWRKFDQRGGCDEPDSTAAALPQLENLSAQEARMRNELVNGGLPKTKGEKS